MIVVDTNLIVNFVVESERTQQAERVFARDPQWCAPLLWRSELRNVLALYFHHGLLSLEDILDLMQRAETLMQDREYPVASAPVLNLAARSRCTAYDCEFVALAQYLGVPLVTFDRQVLSALSSAAISADTFTL